MLPAKDPSTAPPAKIAAGAAIVQKMVDPAAFANKPIYLFITVTYIKKRPKCIGSLFCSSLLVNTYKTTIFCISFSLVPLFVAISMYTPV